MSLTSHQSMVFGHTGVEPGCLCWGPGSPQEIHAEAMDVKCLS